MRTRNLILPFAQLGVLLLTACASSNEVEIDEEKQLELYMTTATYLYQDDSLVRAQDQAVKALALDPGNVPMRRMIGWIRLRLGTTEDVIIAEQFFQDLLDDGDTDTPTLLGMATAQERLGLAHRNAAEAIRSGERYTDHDDPEERADELYEDGTELLDSAYENYTRVLQGSTQRDQAMNGLQRICALRGAYEESLSWGQSLIALLNDDIAFWNSSLEGKDLTETNEKVFRQSIRGAHDLMVETLLLSTSVLHRLGRTADALSSLGLAAELAPERPELYSQRAQLHAEVGRFAAAIEDVDRFLRLSDQPFEDPNVRRAYELRTFCEEQLLAAGPELPDES